MFYSGLSWHYFHVGSTCKSSLRDSIYIYSKKKKRFGLYTFPPQQPQNHSNNRNPNKENHQEKKEKLKKKKTQKRSPATQVARDTRPR